MTLPDLLNPGSFVSDLPYAIGALYMLHNLSEFGIKIAEYKLRSSYLRQNVRACDDFDESRKLSYVKGQPRTL